MTTEFKMVPVEPTEEMLKAGGDNYSFDVAKIFRAMLAAAPASPQAAQPVACDHEWTDDGEFMLVCTACGAQENHDPKWRDMDSAPKDGTLVRLLVAFSDHPTEDADEAPTIGSNSFDNDERDEWTFAGWCWDHDHWTHGQGIPLGWLPMIDTHADAGEVERLTALCIEKDGRMSAMNKSWAACIEERDTLRAQLAERDALLNRAVAAAGHHYLGQDLHNDICDTLSAAAKPEADHE